MENKGLSDINNSFEFINLMSRENLSLSEVYYNLSHYYLGIDKLPEQKFYLARSFQENYFMKWMISGEEQKLLETGNPLIDLGILLSSDFALIALVVIVLGLFLVQLVKKKFRLFDFGFLGVLIVAFFLVKNVHKLGIIKDNVASYSGPSYLFKNSRPTKSGDIVFLLNSQGNFQKVFNSKKEVYWIVKNELIKI